jgi:type IV secretion system protein TrbL
VIAMPLPMWPWDPIVDAVTAPFKAAAGWAWDTVIGGITDWLAKGFVQLVSFVWDVMDRSTSPALNSEWFAHSEGAPYLTAVAVAGGLLLIFLFCALIQGIVAGRPTELVKRMAFDTPAAVAGILLTIAFTQVGIDLVDAMSDGIWSLTRDKAVNSVDGLLLSAGKLSPGSFLTPLLLLLGMLAMLMLWIVLFVREALIYLVVALAPLAWATSVWPAIASVRRRVVELLAALVFCKLAIAMALAVGLGALGGLGATGNPGESTVGNGIAEFSTLVVGIVTFGLAAFMPFLVIKLIPIVEAAVIAQGIQSAPMRAAQTGLQYSYYLNGATGRLAGTGKGVGGAGLVAQTSGGQRASDPATRNVDPPKPRQEQRR